MKAHLIQKGMLTPWYEVIEDADIEITKDDDGTILDVCVRLHVRFPDGGDTYRFFNIGQEVEILERKKDHAITAEG